MSQNTLNLQDSVMKVNGTQMIDANAIARLFSLDAEMIKALLRSYAARPGRRSDVYAEGGLVFTTGQGIVELSRVFPDEFDLEGLDRLASAMPADSALENFKVEVAS